MTLVCVTLGQGDDEEKENFVTGGIAFLTKQKLGDITECDLACVLQDSVIR